MASRTSAPAQGLPEQSSCLLVACVSRTGCSPASTRGLGSPSTALAARWAPALGCCHTPGDRDPGTRFPGLSQQPARSVGPWTRFPWLRSSRSDGGDRPKEPCSDGQPEPCAAGLCSGFDKPCRGSGAGSEGGSPGCDPVTLLAALTALQHKQEAVGAWDLPIGAAVTAVLSSEVKERSCSCPAFHIPPLHISGFPVLFPCPSARGLGKEHENTESFDTSIDGAGPCVTPCPWQRWDLGDFPLYPHLHFKSNAALSLCPAMKKAAVHMKRHC